ncbi:hypothetical protein N657DRAFT_649513 [Parathielavia appendiculata]|uniref:Uncharacterized protein n=1 Tax=Parathielavia appendiculata TaxID=2587402 RepID=A0AAN6TTI7_9PEZI|nr:hypothetical protein N657DRAFT_649513 [Parathielavia appendiculata]
MDEEEMYGEFLGHEMFWSSFGVEGSKAMVTGVGLDVVEFEELEAGADSWRRAIRIMG